MNFRKNQVKDSLRQTNNKIQIIKVNPKKKSNKKIISKIIKLSSI